MCQYCGMTICPGGCPNATEPPVFAECDLCGTEIYDGDEYYGILDMKICESCVSGSYRTAEVD